MINFDRVPAGQIFDVKVSQGTATKTKRLKLCKLKARSILFIEVDKTLRVNTFYKFPIKEVTQLLEDLDTPVIEFKNGVMPEKWESAWDSMGGPSKSVQSYGSFAQAAKPFSNHSKGWSSNAPQYNYGGGAHFRT